MWASSTTRKSLARFDTLSCGYVALKKPWREHRIHSNSNKDLHSVIVKILMEKCSRDFKIAREIRQLQRRFRKHIFFRNRLEKYSFEAHDIRLDEHRFADEAVVISDNKHKLLEALNTGGFRYV